MFNIPKPRYRDFFRQDLIKNLMNISNNGTTPLYKYHVITECVMYACDMCLEFQRKSEGLLTSDWITHITKETGEAIKTILPRDFNDGDTHMATIKVQELMRQPERNLQSEIDRYYHRH